MVCYTDSFTATLLLIYATCICPHLEYAHQLWDPFASKGGQSLEAVQKFPCKVCLKIWDLTTSPCYNYSTSPHCQFVVTISNLPPCTILLMAILQAYLCKITLCTTIVIQLTLIYARTNYMYYSFVPNVVYTWNNLIKSSPCISTSKSSLLYCFYQAHVLY